MKIKVLEDIKQISGISYILPGLLLVTFLLMIMPSANGTQNIAAKTSSANPVSQAPDMEKDLTTLEQKFFEHTYSSDTVSARLERLEKLVFGETRSGSEEERLNKLMAVLPSEAVQPEDNTQNNVSPDSNATSNNSVPEQANNQPSNDENQVPDTSGVDYYPRVTNLEQAICGRTFINLPIRKRLEQLELKAFGKVSQLDDLSQRVSLLEGYSNSLYPQANAVPQTESAPDNNNQAATEDEQASNNEPTGTIHNFTPQALAPYNNPNEPDNNEYSSSGTTNSPAVSSSSNYGKTFAKQAEPKKQHPLLHSLAHALETVGQVAAGALSTVGSSMMSGGYGGYGGNGMGGYGMGGYGMGMPSGGYGMSGYGTGGYGMGMPGNGIGRFSY